MKSIMYHYIREFDNKLPFANFLSISDFKKQIHTCYGWTHQLFKKYNIDLGARKFSK